MCLWFPVMAFSAEITFAIKKLRNAEGVAVVACLLDGGKMALLCREFGIARKTCYKIFNLYKGCGIESVTGAHFIRSEFTNINNAGIKY